MHHIIWLQMVPLSSSKKLSDLPLITQFHGSLNFKKKLPVGQSRKPFASLTKRFSQSPETLKLPKLHNCEDENVGRPQWQILSAKVHPCGLSSNYIGLRTRMSTLKKSVRACVATFEQKKTNAKSCNCISAIPPYLLTFLC